MFLQRDAIEDLFYRDLCQGYSDEACYISWENQQM